MAQTTALIRKQIRSRAWDSLLPSERELCELLQISRVTLRAALAQLEQERVVQVVRGRREVLERQEKNSAKTHEKSVVLLTPWPLHLVRLFDIYCMDELRKHLAHARYHLDVQVQQGCYGPRCEYTLNDLTSRLHPKCWVLFRSTARMQHWFSRHSLPGIIMGSRHSGVNLPSVGVHFQAQCRHAAGLLRAKGHSRLALLMIKGEMAGERRSEKGFVEGAGGARSKAGEVMIRYHEGTRESVCNRLQELLRRSSPPTGFLVSDSESALTALCFFRERGLRVPQDMALICRDHDSFLEAAVPSLAHYSCEPTRFARELSRMVFRIVQGGGSLREVQIMSDFVPGESL